MFVSEPEAAHHSRSEILQNYIRAGGKRQYNLASRLAFQVQAQSSFIAVHAPVIEALTFYNRRHLVGETWFYRLDPCNFSAQIGQDGGAQLAGQKVAEVEDSHF